MSAGAIENYTQAYAESTITDSEQLATAGPVRDGKLLIFIRNIGIGPIENWTGGSVLSFSNLSYDVNSRFGCSFGGFYSSCYYDALSHYDKLGGFDVQLGTAFTLSFASVISSSSDNGFDSNGDGSGTLDEEVMFQFTEIDGTPVTLIVTPEPGTGGLTVMAFCPILLFGLRRRFLPRLPTQ